MYDGSNPILDEKLAQPLIDKKKAAHYGSYGNIESDLESSSDRNDNNGSGGYLQRTTDRIDGSESIRNTVTILELFRFATCCDRLLMTIGAVFAIFEGAGIPAMALIFGRFVIFPIC